MIKVAGAITITPKGTELKVRSNKTIVGVGTSGEIVGGGFFLGTGVQNVIIRNLTIRDTQMIDDDPDDKTYDYDGIQMDTADHIWIERLHGNSLRKRPDYPASNGGSEFRDEWQKVRTRERAFIHALTPAQVAKDLSYTNLKGEAYTWPLPDVLFHIANHGTYHRGQIAQLLRDLGKDAPATDYTVFLTVQ